MPETLLQPNASHELDSQATLSNDTDFPAESYFSSDEIDPNLDLFGDPKENASSSPAAPQSYSHDTTSNSVSYALPFPGPANESNASIEVATHSKSKKRTRSPSPLPQAATTGIVRDHPRKKQKTNNNPRSGSKTKHVPAYIFNAPPLEMQNTTMAAATGAANQNLFRRTLSSSANLNSQIQYTHTPTRRLELDKSPFNLTGDSPIDLVSPSPSPSPPTHSQLYSNINYFDELPETFPKPYTFTATNIPGHLCHPSPLTHTTAIPSTTTNHISTSHQQPQVPSQYTTQMTSSSQQAQQAIPNYCFTEDANFWSGPSLDVNQELNQSLTVNPQQLTRQTQDMLNDSAYLESHIQSREQGQSTFLPDALDPALLQLIQNQLLPPQPQPQSLITIPPPTNNTYPRFENGPGNPISSNHYDSNPYALTQYTNTSMPSNDQLTNHNHNHFIDEQQIEFASTIARQSQLENFANQISIFDKTALFNLFLNDSRFQQRLQLQIHKHCQQQLQLETGNWREANGLLVGRVMALEERYNRQRCVNSMENDTSLINV